MDAVKIMLTLNYIEENFPVDEWEAFGVKIWPIIRFQLGFYLKTFDVDVNIASEMSMSKTAKLYSIIKSLINELKIYLFDYKNNAKVRNKVDAIFLISSPTININGKWFDETYPYIISCEKLNKKALTIQLNPIDYFHIPRKVKSILLKAPIIIRNKITSIFFVIFKGKLAKESNYILKNYDQFIDYCIQNNIMFKQIKREQLLKNVYCINAVKELFVRKLEILKPSTCFKICYYDDVGIALNLACKELGITSVDIQHGVQGDYHFAYGSWQNIPENGYDTLPDYFWCWGEKEVRAIEKWNQKVWNRHIAFEGGNLWLDTWLEDRNEEFAELKKKLKAGMKKKHSFNILYSLQPAEPVKEWVYEAIDRSPQEWSWWVRLHPGMLNQREIIINDFSKKCKNKVEIDMATSYPLPALLSDIDLHVTSYSTVVLEAIEFKVPSIVISETGNDYYRDLIEEGWVFSVLNSYEFNIIIDRLVRETKDLNNICHSKPNSAQSMKKFFKLINELEMN